MIGRLGDTTLRVVCKSSGYVKADDKDFGISGLLEYNDRLHRWSTNENECRRLAVWWSGGLQCRVHSRERRIS